MSYLDGSRSDFPENIDLIKEKYNLPASLKPSLGRFQELTKKQDLSPSEQVELNSLTITLNPYIPDPEYLNFIGDAVINSQKFFKNGVEPYIESKKIEFQQEVDKLTTRGEWQPNVQYYKNNIVTSSGEGYIALKDNVNQPPPNAINWGKIASKGEQGEPSLNINYKGEYDISVAYVLGDAVTFGDLWYYAKKNTKGNPPTSSEYWELGSNQTIIGDVNPFDDRVTGWIDTSL
ncbi:hypothetical protein ACR77J_08200 [Tissierella praeacuta]|uniref:hypothetical protein n=1 Tax=Tissierella praeacuta TaxID=43131 RepID=UPI003DA4BA36